MVETIVCLAIVAAIVALPVYLLFYGMAGRDWKEIKEHDRWKREQQKKK